MLLYSGMTKPIKRSLRSRKYLYAVLAEIGKGTSKYSDIRSAIPHITDPTLAKDLRTLVSEGYVSHDNSRYCINETGSAYLNQKRLEQMVAGTKIVFSLIQETERRLGRTLTRLERNEAVGYYLTTLEGAVDTFVSGAQQ